MFFQTLLQNLLKKKRAKPGVNLAQPTQDLSPMAQNIMQKLAEHDKNNTLSSDTATKSDVPANK